MTDYITSDTHFDHNNICGPNGFTETRKHFQSTEEMNKTIIKNWNAVVTNKDRVYHCGDFSLGAKPERAIELIKQLNGEIVLIKGNHDSHRLLNKIKKDSELSQRVTIYDVGVKIKLNGKVLYLTHYPFIVGNKENLFNFHGHIHEEKMDYDNVINIGVDSPEISGIPPNKNKEYQKFGEPIELENFLEFKSNIIKFNNELKKQLRENPIPGDMPKGSFSAKPNSVDAVKLTSDNVSEVEEWCYDDCYLSFNIISEEYSLVVFTPNGASKATYGDYIVKNLDGSFQTYEPDEFHEKYDAIEDKD